MLLLLVVSDEGRVVALSLGCCWWVVVKVVEVVLSVGGNGGRRW